jgi:hypothetical protein
MMIEKAGTRTIKALAKGQGGMPHLKMLSKMYSRPIYVFDEFKLLKTVVGKELNGQPILLKYQAPNGSNQLNGHWESLNGRKQIKSDSNSCLFDAVAANLSSEIDGVYLRQQVTLQMLRDENENHFDNKIIRELKENRSSTLCMGGSYMNSRRRIIVESKDIHDLYTSINQKKNKKRKGRGKNAYNKYFRVYK